jgi:hypothetical protein
MDGPEESLSATTAHVDSIFPMHEELRRFREGMTEVVELSSAARSREDLVDTLLRALERADTAGVTSLAVTPAEFAWLYFPNTIYMAAPYELPPGLVWFQLQNRSSAGLRRILREHSGKRLYDTGVRCPDDGEPFGSGHIWHGCTVVGELPTGEAVEESLFGSILEWNGRFKLVSFAHRD